MKIPLLACLLLSSFCLTALSLPDTYPKINIISPKILSAKFESNEGISYTIGEYGEVPYGAQFVGGLVLANPRDACTPIKHFSAGEIAYYHNTIAVVKKGNCPTAIKIMNAQNAGAKLVIVVLAFGESFARISGDTMESEMVNIPVVFIREKDGVELIKFLEGLKFPPVSVEDVVPMASISFPYNPVSNTVTLDLWYNVADPESEAYTFLTHLSQFIGENPAFKFTPHTVTWDCYECKQAGYKIPIEDCISGGRYCAPDPDGTGPLNGADVVMESIKQTCIWKNNKQAWWTYTSFYPNQCLKATQINTAECSKSMLDFSYAMGGNSTRVGECIKNSFINAEPNSWNLADNRLMRTERKLQLEYGITQFPVLLINKRPFSGNLSNINEVMGKICKKVSPKPAICKELGFGEGGLVWRFGVIFFVLAAMTVSAMALLGCYRKVIKRDMGVEMSTEANNMVSRYMAVHDLGLTERGEEI